MTHGGDAKMLDRIADRGHRAPRTQCGIGLFDQASGQSRVSLDDLCDVLRGGVIALANLHDRQRHAFRAGQQFVCLEPFKLLHRAA